MRARRAYSGSGPSRLPRFLRDLVFWILQAVVAYLVLVFAMSMRSGDPSTLTGEAAAIALAAAFLLGLLLLVLAAMGSPPEPVASALLPVLIVGSAPWPNRDWAFAAAVVWLVVHLATMGHVLLRALFSRRARRASGDKARPLP